MENSQAGIADSSVKIWDTSTWKLIHDLDGHSAKVEHVCFSPDGSRLVSGSFDRQLLFWNPVSGSQLGALKIKNEIADVVFSPDGNYLAVGTNDWQATDEVLRFEIPNRKSIDALIKKSDLSNQHP